MEAHKGCRKLIAHNCGSSTSKEHPIPLQACEAVYRKLSTSGTSRGKARNVTAFLFPDSIVVVGNSDQKSNSSKKLNQLMKMGSSTSVGSSGPIYPSGGNGSTIHGSSVEGKPHHYDFVLVMKWFSRRSKKRIDMMADKDSPSLHFLEPRASECHSLTFNSISVCQQWRTEVAEAIRSWFEKEEEALATLMTRSLPKEKGGSVISDSAKRSSKRLSVAVGAILTSQSAPILASKSGTIKRR